MSDRNFPSHPRPLSEDMSLDQARAYLRRQGVKGMESFQFRQALQGKDPETAEKMAAVYRLIRTHSPPDAGFTKWQPQATMNTDISDVLGHEPWAEGLSDPTIRKNDFTDPNFLRKTIWEISGKPNGPPISLWIWNGRKFVNHMVVLGKTSKFKEMAKAMFELSRNTAKAIFMMGESDKILLLYLDGHYLSHPRAFTTRAEHRNPNSDWDFVAKLPRLLAGVTAALDDKYRGAYKAWINVEDERVKSFPSNKSYYDAIRENPKMFGVFPQRTAIQARISVEREGWVATGVNTSADGTAAIVNAMSGEQALKAARLLFKLRREEGEWDALRVKTNDEQFTLSNRSSIRAYLMSGKKPTDLYI